MDALIEWMNTNPDWVQNINRAYRHKVINNILMAVFSIGSFTTLIFALTTLFNKRFKNWYSIPIFVAFIGFATCMVLLLMDRSELYQSWNMAMA